jgi:hypothetical protein
MALTMTVTITNDLNLRNTARATMLSLKRTQQSLLEKAIALLRRTLFLQTRRADVKGLSRARIRISHIVRFLTANLNEGGQLDGKKCDVYQDAQRDVEKHERVWFCEFLH